MYVGNDGAYKIRAQPNKTYKDLRQKQKAKISNRMYQAACEYYGEHGETPEGERFFERSGEMVFALEQRRIGEKVKQCPVIRYRDSE